MSDQSEDYYGAADPESPKGAKDFSMSIVEWKREGKRMARRLKRRQKLREKVKDKVLLRLGVKKA